MAKPTRMLVSVMIIVLSFPFVCLIIVLCLCARRLNRGDQVMKRKKATIQDERPRHLYSYRHWFTLSMPHLDDHRHHRVGGVYAFLISLPLILVEDVCGVLCGVLFSWFDHIQFTLFVILFVSISHLTYLCLSVCVETKRDYGWLVSMLCVYVCVFGLWQRRCYDAFQTVFYLRHDDLLLDEAIYALPLSTFFYQLCFIVFILCVCTH